LPRAWLSLRRQKMTLMYRSHVLQHAEDLLWSFTERMPWPREAYIRRRITARSELPYPSKPLTVRIDLHQQTRPLSCISAPCQAMGSHAEQRFDFDEWTSPRFPRHRFHHLSLAKAGTGHPLPDWFQQSAAKLEAILKPKSGENCLDYLKIYLQAGCSVWVTEEKTSSGTFAPITCTVFHAKALSYVNASIRHEAEQHVAKHTVAYEAILRDIKGIRASGCV
jgi:hypothetical protein